MKKKFTLLLLLAVIVSAGASGFIGWRVGYAQGETRMIGLQRGTMVSGYGVLEDLRAGDLARGIERTENMVFSASTTLLGHRYWKKNSTVQLFADEITSYRMEYHSDPEEWSPTEKMLEELLQARQRQSLDD